ncbi:hypothetical protein NPIL_325851 [Nephila pilipes]|uniref:Uncharacterized protein n=1 Tax=Nephila pilipes TaxID=299642 RepID=A0A8X6NER2_NEPPI|nr:hypothetical protein NPIL_325851 [Nephila pilipes]
MSESNFSLGSNDGLRLVSKGKTRGQMGNDAFLECFCAEGNGQECGVLTFDGHEFLGEYGLEGRGVGGHFAAVHSLGRPTRVLQEHCAVRGTTHLKRTHQK